MGLLDNKVSIITASSRGIGLGIVKEFAKEGSITYMAIRNLKASEEVIKELNNLGYIVKPIYFDASNENSYLDMLKTVYDNEGHIDILVNNFGTSDSKTDLDIYRTSYSNFIKTLDDNLKPLYILSQEVIKYMKDNGGSIINISSIGGSVPDLYRIGYSNVKASINYLSKQIALQVARDNIRVNVIAPGMINTDAVSNHLDDNYKNFFLKHLPIKRIGEVNEIAGTALYLASDYSKYTTGQIIEVSGGFGLGTPLFGDIKSR